MIKIIVKLKTIVIILVNTEVLQKKLKYIKNIVFLNNFLFFSPMDQTMIMICSKKVNKKVERESNCLEKKLEKCKTFPVLIRKELKWLVKMEKTIYW